MNNYIIIAKYITVRYLYAEDFMLFHLFTLLIGERLAPSSNYTLDSNIFHYALFTWQTLL